MYRNLPRMSIPFFSWAELTQDVYPILLLSGTYQDVYPILALDVAELTQDFYPILLLEFHVSEPELTQDVYPILALEVAKLDQLLQGNGDRFVQDSPLKQINVTKHSMLLGLKMCA